MIHIAIDTQYFRDCVEYMEEKEIDFAVEGHNDVTTVFEILHPKNPHAQVIKDLKQKVYNEWNSFFGGDVA